MNIGIIGNSRMAKFHLEVFKKIPKVNIACIASTPSGSEERKKTAKKFKIFREYSSYKKMLSENPNLDAVIIASRIDYNYEIAKYCISKKFNSLIEKPIALNKKDALNLIKLANKNKVKVFTGLQRRFYSSSLKIKNIQKKYKLISISIEAPEDFTEILKKKKFKLKVLKKWVLGNGIHCIDLFRFFNGDISNVITRVKNSRGYRKDYNSLIEFKNNTIGIYKSNWESGGTWTVKLYFKKFYILMSPLENCKIYYYSGKVKVIGLSKLDKLYKPGLYLQNYHFLKNLKSKTKYSNYLSDINDAIKTFKLCSLIGNYKK
tara:strand:- start:14135 stop:15088 length:954 start_codon:yes stop_codon:yes gene_type:complete